MTGELKPETGQYQSVRSGYQTVTPSSRVGAIRSERFPGFFQRTGILPNSPRKNTDFLKKPGFFGREVNFPNSWVKMNSFFPELPAASHEKRNCYNFVITYYSCCRASGYAVACLSVTWLNANVEIVLYFCAACLFDP